MDVSSVRGRLSVCGSSRLLAMPDDGYRYELVKGEVIQMAPSGYEHGVRTVENLRKYCGVEDIDQLNVSRR